MANKKVPVQAKPEAALHDQMAEDESMVVASGQSLEAEADAAMHGRREVARNHISTCVVFGIYISALLMLGATVVWALHTFGPPSWRFLGQADQVRAEQAFSHIVIGVVVGFLVKNRFL